MLAPDCEDSLLPATLTDGAFLAFRISDMHRRMQLLDGVYRGTSRWHDRSSTTGARAEAKILSLSFRTVRKDGLILYAASNKDFTAIQVSGLDAGLWTRIVFLQGA